VPSPLLSAVGQPCLDNHASHHWMACYDDNCNTHCQIVTLERPVNVGVTVILSWSGFSIVTKEMGRTQSLPVFSYYTGITPPMTILPSSPTIKGFTANNLRGSVRSLRLRGNGSLNRSLSGWHLPSSCPAACAMVHLRFRGDGSLDGS